MIADFLDSWALFHDAYLAGWLIGVLLSLVGVFVVARDQIFIGAAVSQASLFGIARRHLGWAACSAPRAGGIPSCSTPSWADCSPCWRRSSPPAPRTAAARETPEAVTGWVFLASTSGSILLMSHNRLGMEEINRLLSSTIIGAHRQDVWIFLGLTALTVLLLGFKYRSVVLIALEPEMARVAGLRVGLWNGLLSAWLGIVIGFAIHVSGVVYAFAILVLPALIAKNLGRTARSLFFLAPCASLGTGVVAFVLANHYDYPPGQTAAACLCGLLVCVWLLRAVRPR